jgi:AraC family transcriptional regulator
VVLAGGFVERERDGWRDVGPGTIRVSGPARHDCDFGAAGARCLLLETDEGLAAPPRPRFLAPDPVLARLARRLDTALSPDRFEAPLLATELLAQIARRLGGRAGPPPPWLADVRDAIRDAGGVVDVAALADEAGVHRVHLAATFREHYGVPVSAYAREIRLRAAGRLLSAADVPLAAVAARVGFADQSHLTRTMRSLWGVTPGALRRTLPAFKTGSSPGRHSR